MGVEIVPLLHVFEHLLKLDVLVAFRHQFVKAPLRTNLRRCREENLQLRLREDRRSDITSVHHDSLLLAHVLLLLGEELTHEWECRYKAHVV